jgi:hypothetical protein
MYWTWGTSGSIDVVEKGLVPPRARGADGSFIGKRRHCAFDAAKYDFRYEQFISSSLRGPRETRMNSMGGAFARDVVRCF